MSDKPFTTYEEQIRKLKDDKKLFISDDASAIHMLKKASYFALVNGYKELFKDKATDNYRPGVCFDDLVCLYHFDEQLRSLLMQYILIIERQLKSLILYYFCEKYGDEQNEYLDTSHYQYSNSNPTVGIEVVSLVTILKDTLQSTKYRYINHNRDMHGNVPLWVLINALSFGKVSRFFNLCLPSVQQRVCNEYPNIKITEMSNMLSVLTKFRNVCAHNERLYSYRTIDALSMMEIHKALHLPMTKGKSSYRKGMKDLFAVIIAFKCLLTEEDFQSFFIQLCSLVDSFRFQSNVVNKNTVLSEMGFPSNWKDIQKVSNAKVASSTKS